MTECAEAWLSSRAAADAEECCCQLPVLDGTPALFFTKHSRCLCDARLCFCLTPLISPHSNFILTHARTDLYSFLIHTSVVCRWGSKLSAKLFVARKFVVKHIRSKQEDKVQAEKEKVGL